MTSGLLITLNKYVKEIEASESYLSGTYTMKLKCIKKIAKRLYKDK